MKKGLFLVGLLFSLAASATTVVTLEQVNNIQTAASISTMSMIDWKVGDNQNYKVTLGGFGMEGTMTKEVTKEEGEAVWIKQELKLPIMSDKSELLIDRNSGKILKYIHNGKEEKAPEGEVEIISTKQDTVEVPAGKFKVIHVKAKSKDVSDIQFWINPREISLDGAAKLYMDQGQVKITMVLTKFTKNQ